VFDAGGGAERRDAVELDVPRAGEHRPAGGAIFIAVLVGEGFGA
jgi:hypothetical protein